MSCRSSAAIAGYVRDQVLPGLEDLGSSVGADIEEALLKESEQAFALLLACAILILIVLREALGDQVTKHLHDSVADLVCLSIGDVYGGAE